MHIIVFAKKRKKKEKTKQMFEKINIIGATNLYQIEHNDRKNLYLMPAANYALI